MGLGNTKRGHITTILRTTDLHTYSYTLDYWVFEFVNHPES
jgi:hypothetical protein